jgi:undecaprenyl-diphosphatase
MQDLDIALFGMINAGVSSPLWAIRLARFVSDFLPALMMLAMGVAALFDRRWRRALFTALISLVVVWVIVSMIRSQMPVPRPAFYGLGIQWTTQGVRPGFPSLHAAGSFAVAFSLWSLPWRSPMRAALAMACTVAWSRVYLGLHFPVDVIAAFMLGLLVSVVVEWLLGRRMSVGFERGVLPRLRAIGRRA